MKTRDPKGKTGRSGGKGKKNDKAKEKQKKKEPARRRVSPKEMACGRATEDGNTCLCFLGGLIFISVLSSHGVTKSDDRGRSPTLTIHPPV